MIFLDERDMEKRIRIDPNLARCLDAWDDSTTPVGIVRYLGDQITLPWPIYQTPRPEATLFLVKMVTELAPRDEDKRVSFNDRPGLAAREAVPWNYGDCLNLMIAMGWGNTRLDPEPPTAREFGEEVKRECDAHARALALRILEHWALKGYIHRI